jgi:phage tail-like protein
VTGAGRKSRRWGIAMKKGFGRLALATALLAVPASSTRSAPVEEQRGGFRLRAAGRDIGPVEYLGGVGAAVEVIDRRVVAGGKETTSKRPGSLTLLDLKLRRTQTSDDLRRWREDVLAGKDFRREVTLSLLDEAGKAVAEFALANAWPSAYAAELSSSGSTVTETVTLVYEEIVRK